MTLDEAIKHCEEVADSDCYNDKQIKCADEHRQLAEWLKDYKRMKEQEPKTGHCKDCKWWKDSDGAYRRGVGAESQCPINRREVFEGSGYCYLFEPQESEADDGNDA